MPLDPDDDLEVETTLDASRAPSDQETQPQGEAGGDAPVLGGQLGRYRIAGFLGSGGMGFVFAAYDPQLDRKVALKVLRSTGHASATLVDEARAMARLSHPNVVTVFETGRLDGQEFLAMELVEGQTLRTWQNAAPRPWRQTVAMYVAAGNGLVAAHDVGLVHRDFKPENVLIGADGRPRVADFGLVVSGLVPSGDALARGELRRSMTVNGRAAGTPLYMAPEQWRGGEVRPAADQFAFCVCLWEALCGARPFPGEVPRDVRASVARGVLAPPPGGRMPRWLEAALRRGLSVDEAQRWPSMRALVDELVRRTQPAGRGAILLAATAVALAGAGYLATRPGAACPAPVERAGAVWSPARRGAIGQHLASVDPAQGSARLAGLAPVLDEAIGDWREMHVAACTATRVEGRQSDLLLDRRMRCLDDWLAELDARIGALDGAADPATVDSAAQGLVQLSSLSACADGEALLSASPPPSEAQQVEAAALAAELRELRVAPIRDLKRADALLTRARALGYAPLEAEALDLRAASLLEADDLQRAPGALQASLELAARIRDDRRAASAWLRLLRLQAFLLVRPDRAALLIPAAETAVARAGNPLELRVELLVETAAVLADANRVPEALARLGEARLLLASATADRRGSPLGSELADVLSTTGVVRIRNRQPEEALGSLAEARRLLVALHGPDHPRLVDVDLYRSEALAMLGRGEESLAEAQAGLRIRELRQPGTAALAETLSLVGISLYELRRMPEALAATARAVELGRRHLPADSIHLALLLARHAGPQAALGHLVEAEAFQAEALRIHDRAGTVTRQLALTRMNHADLLLALDRHEAAIVEYRRAAAMLDEVVGPGSAYLINVANGLGEALLALGRGPEAIPELEAALLLPSSGYFGPQQLYIRYLLGRILVESRRDLVRGQALIDEARRGLVVAAAAKEPYAEMALTRLDAWRKARRR